MGGGALVVGGHWILGRRRLLEIQDRCRRQRGHRRRVEPVAGIAVVRVGVTRVVGQAGVVRGRHLEALDVRSGQRWIFFKAGSEFRNL
jgi:hypothetical protein